MKLTKILSSALALCMVASLAVGCAPKDEPAPPSSAAPSSAPVTDTPAPAPEAGGKIAKITPEKTTYKMVTSTYADQVPNGDMQFFKTLEEQTNIAVEWDCIVAQNYGEKKNLMFTTNALPDAFFGYASVSMDDINNYGVKGQLIPLDDLIAANAPNYQIALKEEPLLGGLSTAFDGKTYSMGTVIEQTMRDFPGNLFINKTWLDKLGLQVPTTIDEYYTVLEAFKSKDPNGNSKADEIPYEFRYYNHITGYGQFFGAYGRVDVHNGSSVKPDDHFVVEDGKVVFTADKEEYKAAIKDLKRFVDAGLWDKEGFTQDNNQLNAKLTSPEKIVGSFYGWAETTAGVDNAANFIPIAPLKGPSGAEPSVMKRQNHINVMSTGFSITPVAKNPENLVKWVDNFYTLEMGITSQFGPVGIGVEYKDEANLIFEYLPDPEKPENPLGTRTFQLVAPMDNAPKYLPWEIFGKNIPYNPGDIGKINAIDKFYANAKHDLTLPNMNFTPEELAERTAYTNDISNYVKEMQTKWFLGQADIDKDWDKYIKQLDSFNLTKYVALMQGAYDRSMGK